MTNRDYRQLKAAFDEDGFITVPQLLPPEEWRELNVELDRYIRNVVPGLTDQDAFYVDKSRPETLKQLQHMGSDSFFREYSRRSAWTDLAEALLGEPVDGQDPEWFNKPAGTKSPTPPHQDNYYFCLQPANVVTIWLALDPVDDENGCLRYVRGSHRRGVRPHGRSNVLGFSQGISDFGDDDLAQEVAVHLSPGDAVAHHGNMIHRAEPNRSAIRNRRSFAIVYRGVSCRRDENAFARYMANLKEQHVAMGLQS